MMKTPSGLLSAFFLFILLLSACTDQQATSAPTLVPSPTLALPTATPTPEPLRALPVSPVNGLPQGSDGYPWWNDTVFYEIFVRSFYDSDGDGIGDFNGIIEKLDYLNDGDPQTTTDLGITGIWLMPIFPSPSYHGYDVTDYYAVNPDYGTLDDFKRLLDEAHRRGIRIIIDYVLNHTSSQHPWFREALDPASPKRDWYIWSETDPGGVGPWGQKIWYPSPNGQGYYYAVFWDQMPDINQANPEVVAEFEKITTFWLDEVGVDGFRLDGARYLVEEGGELADTAANHQWFKDFRKLYKGLNPQAFTVGEIWTSNFAVTAYVKNSDELDTAFDFDLASAILKSVNERKAQYVRDAMKFNVKLFLGGRAAATFITNHDQPRVINQVVGVPAVDKARLAATLLMVAPGVPFVYYGEEIGMSGKKPDEFIRTPMQWSAEKYAGFTSGTPWEAVNKDYTKVNVAAQMDDPDSLLSLYRRLIYLRNQHAALRVGDFIVVESQNPQLLAFLRISAEETLLVLVNLSKDPLSDYSLSLASGPLSGTYQAVTLEGVSAPPLTSQADGGFAAYVPLAELPANGVVILQLQPSR